MSNIATLNRKGRKPGATNLKTRAQEAMQRAAAASLAAGVAELATMTPLDCLLAIMRASFAAGDLQTARQAAESAAGYCHARRSPVADDVSIPPELQADPPPTPDQEGPERPIY